MAKVQVEILAIDKVTSELGKINTQISGFSRKVESAFGGLSKAAGMFSGALGAVFAANKVAEIVNAGLQYGHSVKLLSDRIGMGVEETQKWKYVTDRMGVSLDSLDRPLRAVDKMVYEDSKKLKDLGIATRDSNNQFRSKSAVLQDVLLKLAAIPSPTERSAIASDIFGRAAGNMLQIVGEGPEKIRQLIGETEQYGLVLSEQMIEKLDRAKEKQELLNKQLEITKVKFVAAVSPLVSTWLSGANQIIDKLSQWISGEEDLTEKTVTKEEKVASMRAELELYSNAVKGVKDNSGNFMFEFENLVRINGEQIPISQALEKIRELKRELKTLTADSTRSQPGEKKFKQSFEEWRAGETEKGLAKMLEKQQNIEKKRKASQEKFENWSADHTLKTEEQKKEAFKSSVDRQLDNLMELTEGHKSWLGFYKAAAIASTTWDTYTAAQADYKAAVEALGFPAGPIVGAVLAGIDIAAGLGRVAKIASSGFASGGYAAPGQWIRTGEQRPEDMYMLPGGGAIVYNNANNSVTRNESTIQHFHFYNRGGSEVRRIERAVRSGEARYLVKALREELATV